MQRQNPELTPEICPNPSRSGGSRDDRMDGLLRRLEIKTSRLETKLEHMLTKEDLEGVKTLIAEKEAINAKWMMVFLGFELTAILIVLIRTFY